MEIMTQKIKYLFKPMDDRMHLAFVFTAYFGTFSLCKNSLTFILIITGKSNEVINKSFCMRVETLQNLSEIQYQKYF